jgi:hypothetical protein
VKTVEDDLGPAPPRLGRRHHLVDERARMTNAAGRANSDDRDLLVIG